MSAQPIEDMVPGSFAWLQRMSASKVAAVMGLSPWTSPFSLWHELKGTVCKSAQTTVQSRGHYLEGAVTRWWSDQHIEFDITCPAGSFEHPTVPRHTASPDGLVFNSDSDSTTPVALLEVKTSGSYDEWVDGVPVYYRVQCLWQLYVLGLRTCYVAVLTAGLEFREFVVEQDETDLALIHAAVAAFMQSLDDDVAPSIDGHSETYATIRRMHPDIEDLDVEISAELAGEFRTARAVADLAKAENARLTSLVADAIGSGKRAVVGPDRIAYRKAGKPGVAPFLQAYPLPKESA